MLSTFWNHLVSNQQVVTVLPYLGIAVLAGWSAFLSSGTTTISGSG